MPKQPVRIDWDLGTMRIKAKALGPALNMGIAAVMEKKAGDVQDYARTHAPWNDQTGNARNGLFAKYEGGGGRNALGQFTTGSGKGVHVIRVFHTVPYGIWLEVRFAGKNAIIRPTLQAQGPQVMRAVQGLLGKLGAVA